MPNLVVDGVAQIRHPGKTERIASSRSSRALCSSLGLVLVGLSIENRRIDPHASSSQPSRSARTASSVRLATPVRS